MSRAAEELLRLTAKVDEAAAALVRARFDEFAEAAAALDAAAAASPRPGETVRTDPESLAACKGLRRSLDRLGVLLGRTAGVQQALREFDPGLAGRRGRLVREEA
jgi:hypothetical protein